jgi:hypothetical protein
MAAPAISISSVIPGTTTSTNTGRVELSWSVSGATSVWVYYGSPGMEVLPDGVLTDWASGGSDEFPSTSDSLVFDVRRTTSVEIFATNADGTTTTREVLYSKIPVGYHDASMPGAPVTERDLRMVRGFLEDIDSRLRSNVLTTLPDYIDRWNRDAPDSAFPNFSDMSYLSGAVGTGNLADDILSAMRDVLIYIHPHTMTRGQRPGTITDPDRRALCERSSGGGAVFGRATREWVSICTEAGGDELTLLHELFHYASRSNNGNEARAFAVSLCAYNVTP